jgi:ABC-2 type transport system permease protein
MRIILALARKDLRVLTRVRSGIFFTFVWPIVVAILFGMVFAGQGQSTARALRIVVVDEDATEQSRAFLTALEASGDFALDRAERAEAEALVRRGQRAAYVASPRASEKPRRRGWLALRVTSRSAATRDARLRGG